jgi:hypothetical protein
LAALHAQPALRGSAAGSSCHDKPPGHDNRYDSPCAATSSLSLSMESTWDGTRARQSRSRTPRVAGLPSNRSRPGFSLELGRAVITRQPLLRSESLTGNPRPSRTSVDFREGVTMQPLCNPRAVAPIDQSRTRPRPGQVPIRRRAQWRIGAITSPALSRVPCPGRPRARRYAFSWSERHFKCQRSACQWAF